MYNFKKNIKLYIVELNSSGVPTNKHLVEIYNDISASQTFDEQSYKQKSLHNLVHLHDQAVVNNANIANFSFTTPILNIATTPLVLSLGGDYSTGTIVNFDIYIESDNVIYKLTKCVIESLTFNIEKSSVLTASVSGSASMVSKFGNVGAVTIPGTTFNVGTKAYVSIDRLSVVVSGVSMSSIAALNVDIKNEISWTQNTTVNDAIAGNMVYPASYVLQGRTFSGSITQFLTSDNVDTLSDTSTSASVVIGIFNEGYSSTTPILQFNLPSTVFTRRLNFEELINRVYDFRLNSNLTIVKPIYKGV
jgi:putative transposon-encoded protein